MTTPSSQMHLRGAGDTGVRRASHRLSSARRAPSHAWRADRPELRRRACRVGGTRPVWRRDDRCDASRHQEGEDRKLFREAMQRIGLDVPCSAYAYSVADAEPLPLRWAGPWSSARASRWRRRRGDRLQRRRARQITGIGHGPVTGERGARRGERARWKEYEMEVMRDANDNCVIVCSIENFDAMGVHTGTPLPSRPRRLSPTASTRCSGRVACDHARDRRRDRRQQRAVRREPSDGRLVVIEMNPRVSRSSALASKAPASR